MRIATEKEVRDKRKIQVIRCNKVYFSSFNVWTDTIVIIKD